MSLADFLAQLQQKEMGNMGGPMQPENLLAQVQQQQSPMQQAPTQQQMPQQMPQQQPMAPPQQKRGGLLGFLGNPDTRDAMGQMGDYLLQANDMAPIYGPRKARRDQQQMGEKLAQYLGADDEQLMEIFRADPQTGMMLLKMKGGGEAFTLGDGQVRYDAKGNVIAGSPQASKPDIVVIDGVAFDKRTGLPQFESPYSRIIPGPDGSFFERPRLGLGRNSRGGELPRVTSPDEAMQLPPGSQFMLPDGRVGTVPGGAGGNASGGFPASQ